MFEKIGFDEAAVIIGCSVGTLRNSYKKWRVPHYKIAGKVKFSEHELHGWMESLSHKYPETED